jgi:hypothetical protein
MYPALDPATGLPTGLITSSAEWVFVYNVSGSVPVQKQKLNLPITDNGLVWDASGDEFYASGGSNDIVYPFKKANGSFQPDAPFIVLNTGGQLDNTVAGPACTVSASRPTRRPRAWDWDGSTPYTAILRKRFSVHRDTKSRQSPDTWSSPCRAARWRKGSIRFGWWCGPARTGTPTKCL